MRQPARHPPGGARAPRRRRASRIRFGADDGGTRL